MTVTVKRLIISFCLLLLAAPAFADEEETEKLPVPRFVSIKSSEVNMRVGPGTRYSINWVYKRENYPVEIIEEFDQWRKIRDKDGTTGWVHKQMLQGRRYGIVQGAVRVLRQDPEEKTRPVLRMEPGVIVRLIECEKDWCRLQVDGRKGWLEKKSFWGAYAKEEF